MFSLSLSLTLSLLVAVACGVVIALGWWCERQDRRRNELERRKVTFLCVRCERLYTAKPLVPLCACPRCGFKNERLSF